MPSKQLVEHGLEQSKFCVSNLNIVLPAQWMHRREGNELIFSKMILHSVKTMEHFVVERKLTLDKTGNLPPAFIMGKSFPPRLLGLVSICSTIDDLKSSIDKLNSTAVCNGVLNMRMFETFPNGVQIGNSWFANTCETLVPPTSVSMVCPGCETLKVSMTKEASKIIRGHIRPSRS